METPKPREMRAMSKGIEDMIINKRDIARTINLLVPENLEYWWSYYQRRKEEYRSNAI